MNYLPTFQEYEETVSRATAYQDQTQLLVVGKAIELALEIREKHNFHKITAWVGKYRYEENNDTVQCGYYEKDGGRAKQLQDRRVMWMRYFH